MWSITKQPSPMESVICSTVASVLNELELPYENQGKVFSLSLESEEAVFPTYIIADDENEVLSTIGLFPIKVSRANLDRMYQFINGLNLKTMIGFFAIDPDDGQLLFCLANNVDGGAINEDIVKASLLQVAYRLRKNYEDIMKAMFGGEQFIFSFSDGKDLQEGRI